MEVYKPLVILLHAALLAAAVGVIVVLPIHLFSFWGIGKAVVFTLLAALGVGIMIFLGYKGWKAYDAAADASRKRVEEIHKQGGLTLREIVAARISGAKHKICPFITIARSE